MAHGRSYEEVDEMTLFDVRLIYDYWAEHPPTDEILALVYGLKPKAPEPIVPASKDDPSGIGGLILAFPNGYVPANR